MSLTGGTSLGTWTTDIGDVNSIVALRRWPRQELADRLASDRTRWFDELGDAIQQAKIEHLQMLPLIQHPEPGKLGSIYEMRTYRMRVGRLTETIEAWRESFARRVTVSPAIAVMQGVTGDAMNFVQIWAYRDHAHSRQR